MKTLYDPSVCARLTPQELLCCVKRLEERLCQMKPPSAGGIKDSTGVSGSSALQATSAKGTPERKTRKSRFNEKGEPLCFNCASYGHLSVNCSEPQQRPRCDVCKHTGHDEKNCPSKATLDNSKGQKQVLYTVEDGSPNSKYFIDAVINDRPVKAHVALGSQCVTMRLSDAK